jgi:hypothetical protein
VAIKPDVPWQDALAFTGLGEARVVLARVTRARSAVGVGAQELQLDPFDDELRAEPARGRRE